MLTSKLPRLTIALGTVIIISATFTKQLSDFIKANIGERGFLILVGIIIVVTGLSVFIFIIKGRPKFIRILLFAMALIIGIVLTWRIKIPVEKLHILEYAALGWIAGRDLIKENKKIKGILLAYAICMAVGVVDELFQKLLPYRYCDLRDVLFNSLGSSWGVILYLIS